ncbi:hypothetical protein BOX15_Mlig029830g2, partial [Macrostomum lignano]
PRQSILLLILQLIASSSTKTARQSNNNSRSNRLATINDANQLANLCMMGRLHKAEPGPEPGLTTGPCIGYSDSSCCTAEVGSRLGSNDEFAQAAFRLDHCGRRLSAECEKWFERSRCLYECSPNLGPWLVKVSGYSWRTERAYGVPLCHSQCQAWYAACAADLSCVSQLEQRLPLDPPGQRQRLRERVPDGAAWHSAAVLPSCTIIRRNNSAKLSGTARIQSGARRVALLPAGLVHGHRKANPNLAVTRAASREKVAAFYYSHASVFEDGQLCAVWLRSACAASLFCCFPSF